MFEQEVLMNREEFRKKQQQLKLAGQKVLGVLKEEEQEVKQNNKEIESKKPLDKTEK